MASQQPSTSASASAAESSSSQEDSQNSQEELYSQDLSPKEKLQADVIAEVRKYSCLYDKRKFVMRKQNVVKTAWISITEKLVEMGHDVDGKQMFHIWIGSTFIVVACRLQRVS